LIFGKRHNLIFFVLSALFLLGAYFLNVESIVYKNNDRLFNNFQREVLKAEKEVADDLTLIRKQLGQSTKDSFNTFFLDYFLEPKGAFLKEYVLYDSSKKIINWSNNFLPVKEIKPGRSKGIYLLSNGYYPDSRIKVYTIQL